MLSIKLMNLRIGKDCNGAIIESTKKSTVLSFQDFIQYFKEL